MEVVLVKYVHFIGIMCVMASLVAEHLLVTRENTPARLQRLFVINVIYVASLGLVLLSGLLMWFQVGPKPVEYYSSNWLFHLKLTCFVLIALLGIHPTIFFSKNRRSDEDAITMPKSVIMVIRMELLLLLILPLLAVLMTRGYGIIASN